jgi:DNA-binding MarR family transcriptional regulator
MARVEEAIDAMRRAMARARDRFTEGLGLTRTQVDILALLIDRPHTTSKLAEQLYLTQGAVTQTLDSLVRRDLVMRRPSQTDRRVCLLEISPSGRKLTDNLMCMRRERMQEFLDALTDDEVEALISINKKLTYLLNERRAPIVT